MVDFFQGPQGLALKHLAETLWSKGFAVYLAGGCVRDALLGRTYHDLDVVTDAPTEDVQALFPKTIPVGVQFGIVRVLLEGFEFEVARFRSDGPYEDGRRPSFVRFTGPKEDAARRDFTINALFYDLKSGQVLDFVGGREDLAARRLRAVGNASLRFAEDYLRILRLLRFSCQLHFDVDPETDQAASALVSHLAEVSGERLQSEVCKSLKADPELALRGFNKWNLPSILFPAQTVDSLREVILRGLEQPGLLLVQWLLGFHYSICEKSVEWVSKGEWCFSKQYLELTAAYAQRFRLSRHDGQLLRDAASVLAWSGLWSQWRPGLRAFLAQSVFFGNILSIAEQLGVWDASMVKEVQGWRAQAQVQPFLSGRDIEFIVPGQRGLVLKEALYLQYEGVLTSKEMALAWAEKNTFDL